LALRYIDELLIVCVFDILCIIENGEPAQLPKIAGDVGQCSSPRCSARETIELLQRVTPTSYRQTFCLQTVLTLILWITGYG